LEAGAFFSAIVTFSMIITSTKLLTPSTNHRRRDNHLGNEILGGGVDGNLKVGEISLDATLRGETSSRGDKEGEFLESIKLCHFIKSHFKVGGGEPKIRS